MFNFLATKSAYQLIPDSVEVREPQYDGDFQFSSPPLRRPQPGAQDQNIRHRGAKRLIERGGDFHQSTGKIALRKKIRRRNFRALYGMDLFHSLVDAPTTRIIVILMGTYLMIVMVFAVIYYTISSTIHCNLGIHTMIEAFAFSLETMATIGYGTKDIFFGSCISTLAVLSVQICVKLIVDAVTIGVLYSKFSRPHARASTVIFSDKGVIRRIRGKLYFMFQLCELRKHQLVEAHVRVYAVRKEIDLASCFSSDAGDEEEHTHTAPAAKAPQHSVFGFSFRNKDNSSMSSDEGSMTGDADAQEFSTMKYHTLPNMPPLSAQHSQTGIGGAHQQQRPSYMQTSAMRLNHPNDELGGMLLLMTPQVVVHEIDAGSPLMPPPVWYCNYPTGEFAEHGAGGSTGLGIQESGDCIRWRPPAYRGFIQHLPPQPMWNPEPFTQPQTQGQGQTPAQQFVQTQEALSAADSARSGGVGKSAPSPGISARPGTSRAKSRKSIHRYNDDSSAGISVRTPTYLPGLQGVGFGTIEEDEDVCTVDDVDSLFSPPSRSTAPSQGLPPLPPLPPQPPQAPPQMWYYDAEALARIEFPSVNRRIDTDNISAGAPATTATGYGEYATAAGTAGQSNGVGTSGTAPNGMSYDPSTPVRQVSSHALSSLNAGPHVSFYAPASASPHLSNASTPKGGDDEGRVGADWQYKSAGLSGFAELLNASRTASPLEGARSNAHSASTANMQSRAPVSQPVLTDLPEQPATPTKALLIEELEDTPASPAPQSQPSPAQAAESADARTQPATTSPSRIPVLSRPPSAYSLLAQPAFPPQVAPIATGASSDTTGNAPAQSSAPSPPALSVPVPSRSRGPGMFLNPQRPYPADSTAPPAPEGTDVSPAEDKRLTRQKSKKDVYVSPYKQTLRPASSTAAMTLAVDSPTGRPPWNNAYTNGGNGSFYAGGIADGVPVPRTVPAGSKSTAMQSQAQPLQSASNAAMYGSFATNGPAAGQGNGAANEYGNGNASGNGNRTGDGGNVTAVYQGWQSEERSMVQRYMRDRQVEIIVIVEGVDAATGGMVQARHSYTSEEIEWDKSFECCVFKDPLDGCTTIDFSMFHELHSVPTDAPFAGVVHSCI